MNQELKKAHEWNMADTVTTMRMAASLFLFFIPLKSIWFLVIYTFAGLTDVLDGWLARKTGRASEFGARLDSVADLLFYSVLLTRLFPVLYQMLPGVIWYAVSGIVLVRLASYVTAAVKYHRFASLHSLCSISGGTGNSPFEDRLHGEPKIHYGEEDEQMIPAIKERI